MYDPNEEVVAANYTRQLFDAFPDSGMPFLSAENNVAMNNVLKTVTERLQDNYPYHSPLYAGQMLKPPHPIAREAYALAMHINPNNHALDGGRASSAMEREAVAHLASMFGYEEHLGHLTSGGTMANLEALWIAGQVTVRRTVLASEQCHYTHPRICGVLGLPFESMPVDRHARLDPQALYHRLKKGDVGTVVVTMGTTATGSVDPLPEILAMRRQFGFRIHVDAAYGGYYVLADNLRPETRAAFDVIGEAASIVVDPHKHGLQPYGCGCILFRDPSVGRFYKHDSPYTYFTSNELHLGEISLECSRPGAAAVALWATQRLLPNERGGEFAGSLAGCRRAALDLHQRLASDDRFLPPFEPELDIVVWAMIANSVSQASAMARRVFDEAEKLGLYLALAELPVALFDLDEVGIERGRDTITCLRSCLMKPEHEEWLPKIWELLDQACSAADSRR
jgi:glutamate/tyrosine decarboxylase-like PLP-dependent enzyme